MSGCSSESQSFDAHSNTILTTVNTACLVFEEVCGCSVLTRVAIYEMLLLAVGCSSFKKERMDFRSGTAPGKMN